MRFPRAHKVPAGIAPTAALGVLGTTGLTACFGMVEVRPGDVVLVSGAAGATGSVAGQIARLAGAHTIGLADGPEKSQWLTETARFDSAIDYKADDVADRIAELAPRGVNLFYDNVAAYGPTNLSTITVRSASMAGFIVTDFLDRFDEAADRLTAWIRTGDIVWAEDVQKGTVEDAVDTLNRLFDGKNFGKQILQIAEPTAAC
ncbi:NADP-dependent oxidoreductase [Mycobacterium sp. 21AC1]|uniref:NADP-dependent oxidoreductase n=1 Tax=[Mycobacterium] appelbergii TaxID=2939269 RepID=UPI0029395290|nr:NADP-dependent oxidoreductase [Mycobacterium sp. 21AC1]MDV3125931.1 NADP-dependent oxidoreductase [Mycobacterium sp. 21AC1]